MTSRESAFFTPCAIWRKAFQMTYYFSGTVTVTSSVCCGIIKGDVYGALIPN
jgi:hypothetical protein